MSAKENMLSIDIYEKLASFFKIVDDPRHYDFEELWRIRNICLLKRKGISLSIATYELEQQIKWK